VNIYTSEDFKLHTAGVLYVANWQIVTDTVQ